MSVKRAALLVGAIAAIGGTAYGTNQYQIRRNADKMLEQARGARENRILDDARLLYEAYLNFQPRDVDAIGEYAALLESDESPKAKRALLDCYERLLRVAPNRATERKKLVAMYMTYRVFPTAKHHLEALLDATTGTPDDPELLQQSATCEFRLGRTADGIAILRKLIDTGKAGAEVYQSLAGVLRRDGSAAALDEAEQVIAQMAKDLANDTGARVVRINHLNQSGRTAEARAEIVKAAREVREPEKSADFSLLLADHYARERLFEAAREVLVRAIGANPNEPRLRTAYYQILDQLQDKTKADLELKKALELAANNDPGTIDLIDLMIDNRETDLARREIERRFKGRETFKPVHDYLSGRVLLAEGNWPAALESLTRCLEFFEKYPAHYSKAQVAIAQCRTLANNPERALEAYSRAAAANPNSNAARLGKAETLLRLNRLKDAEPILRDFAGAIPSARLVLANALVVEQLGRPVNLRDWTEVERAFGAPPCPVGIEILKAKVLALRGQAEDGEKLLKSLIVRASDSMPARIALAEFAARRNPKEAGTILDAGREAIGDTFDYRMARATLAARSRDIKTIRSTTENVGAFSIDQRHALFLHVANILFAIGQPDGAAELAATVAQERPFDLPSRMLLAQIHLQSGQLSKLEPILLELKTLDGESGPLYLYATVMGELASTPKPDASTAARMRERLETIIRKREVWTRPHVLLGDLALRMNDTDAAHKHYRRAYDLGERDETTFRKLLDLALSRDRTKEAYRLLDDRDKIAGLPADLLQTHALLEAATGQGGERSRDIVRRTEGSADPNVQFFRGRWLLLNGERPEAAKAFERTVGTAPQLTEAWVAWVRALALFDLAAARVTATRAASALTASAGKVSPPAKIPLAIGNCQEAIGDYAAAERAYLAGLQQYTNDLPLRVALADLYRRAGRHTDADIRCREILNTAADDDLKRWARRGLALAPQLKIDDAIAILQPNLNPVEHSEDLRLKAFLMARDPFRRMDAHRILEQSAARDPLSADESAQRAALFLQEGRLQLAESDLQDATRLPTCKIEHLIALHRVQLQSGHLEPARSTLNRIDKRWPGRWEAVAERARLLAAQGDKAGAIQAIRGFPNSDNPDFLLLAAGPLLAELRCTAEAETAFRTASAQSKLPQRHAGLILFLIENERPIDAIRTVRALAPADCPPPMTKAALLKNAIATRHRAAIAPAELAEWDRLVSEAIDWIDQELKMKPKEMDLLQARAAILDASGNTPAALAAYESILALDPDQIVALNNLASLLILSSPDQSDRPLQLINRAIANGGARGHLLDTRATILIAAGKTKEALADLAVARLTGPRPVYDFHAALAAEAEHEGEKRRSYLESARSKGFKKIMLHPKEWPSYEKMYGPD